MKNEFIYPLRVHIEDTDFAGVVYHSNYLNFMERARSEWVHEMGLGIEWQREHKIYFPVFDVHIKFLKPARLHEKIEVVSKITAIKPASIIFDQHLRLAGSPDTLLCTAEVKVACTDYTMRPRSLPEAPFLESIRRMLT